VKKGYLSEYFSGVAAKRLSAVEADPVISHQHEFNGVKELVQLFGEASEKRIFEARFIYLTDSEDEPLVEDSTVTWYDSRAIANERKRAAGQKTRAAEHRLYFKTTCVSQNAAAGDLLVIAKSNSGGLLFIVAENQSSIASQIEWLFGFSDLIHPGFSVKSELESEQDRIAFASTFILENIGVTIEESAPDFLEEMLSKFSVEIDRKKFPTTAVFSAYARSTIDTQDLRGDPDVALMAYMQREEILFRTLERHLIADRLSQGFGQSSKNDVDVDGFISYSLSVQNRRKSRVGLALENHLEVILKQSGIKYSRAAQTEDKAKPDFIFPSISDYHDPQFEPKKLTMLGVKSTCKDRWRQVLAEAMRIEHKHLLTLEAAISSAQTAQMKSHSLTLVLPKELHKTFLPHQITDLMTLSGFVDLVGERQR
jgi:EcoRII C terminal